MMYNGCQILVTTPRYLTRFLNENKGLLSFDGLSYLVLDNADVILKKYYNSVSETCYILSIDYYKEKISRIKKKILIGRRTFQKTQNNRES